MKLKLILVVGIFSLSTNIFTSEAFLSLNEIDVKKAVNFYNRIPGITWKASSNGFSGKVKLSAFKSRLGLLLKQFKNLKSSTTSSEENSEEFQLPIEYDARLAYPNSTTIPSIKDQSNCGSCWAVCTAAAFSDRLHVASGGKLNHNMSAEQLMTCSKKDKGCNGGHLDTAWEFIRDEGLGTGGDYGSNEGCQPYSIPPKKKGYLSETAKTPACSKKPCPMIYKAKNIENLPADEYEIRREILKNGPVTAAFMVHFSFMFYREGIYSRTFIDIPLGGHGVRIIGWGEENNKKYWLIANSWGRKWGENGTFRMKRGTDHCGIESNVFAGIPVL